MNNNSLTTAKQSALPQHHIQTSNNEQSIISGQNAYISQSAAGDNMNVPGMDHQQQLHQRPQTAQQHQQHYYPHGRNNGQPATIALPPGATLTRNPEQPMYAVHFNSTGPMGAGIQQAGTYQTTAPQLFYAQQQPGYNQVFMQPAGYMNQGQPMMYMPPQMTHQQQNLINVSQHQHPQHQHQQPIVSQSQTVSQPPPQPKVKKLLKLVDPKDNTEVRIDPVEKEAKADSDKATDIKLEFRQKIAKLGEFETQNKADSSTLPVKILAPEAHQEQSSAIVFERIGAEIASSEQQNVKTENQPELQPPENGVPSIISNMGSSPGHIFSPEEPPENTVAKSQNQQDSLSAIVSEVDVSQPVTPIMELPTISAEGERRMEEAAQQPMENGDPSKITESDLRRFQTELDAFEQEQIDKLVYGREFLMLIRHLVKKLKPLECPLSEKELVELGLDRTSVPTINISKPKHKFDGGPSDFKTNWQSSAATTFMGPQQNRFSVPRHPYVGRHSDNKIGRKKPPIARQSMDRQPKAPQEILPKRASNAWKPKREERFDLNAAPKDENVTKYDKITKDIRGLLNKVTPSTYEELAEEFAGYNVHTDPILLDKIIDLIFEKAVEEPRFCPLYSDLCKKQVEIESKTLAQNPAADNTFRKGIIIKCQQTFTHSQKSNEDVKGLETKMAEEKDEKAKNQLKEEIDTLKSKEKRRLLGIIRFIAQLYRHQLLTNQIITWCVVELVKQYEASSEDIYIEYAVQMVETVGEVYEQRIATKQPPPQQPATPQPPKSAAQAAAKQSTPPPAQPQKSEIDLDTIFAHFATLKPRMTNRVRFMIMNLEELRTQGWKTRGGDKGPKTVEEVRNEVEQEQQVNEQERMAYEQKKMDSGRRDRDMRKQPPRSYGGRPSQENKAQYSSDKRQAAAQAAQASMSSNAGTHKESRSLKDVDKIDKLMAKNQPGSWSEAIRKKRLGGCTGSTPPPDALPESQVESSTDNRAESTGSPSDTLMESQTEESGVDKRAESIASPVEPSRSPTVE